MRFIDRLRDLGVRSVPDSACRSPAPRAQWEQNCGFEVTSLANVVDPESTADFVSSDQSRQSAGATRTGADRGTKPRLSSSVQLLRRANLSSLRALCSLLGDELHCLTLAQRLEAASLNLRIVRKQVLTTVVWRNESEPFAVVKPLDFTFNESTRTVLGSDSRVDRLIFFAAFLNFEIAVFK
jgi:hypothetical protein